MIKLTDKPVCTREEAWKRYHVNIMNEYTIEMKPFRVIDNICGDIYQILETVNGYEIMLMIERFPIEGDPEEHYYDAKFYNPDRYYVKVKVPFDKVDLIKDLKAGQSVEFDVLIRRSLINSLGFSFELYAIEKASDYAIFGFARCSECSQYFYPETYIVKHSDDEAIDNVLLTFCHPCGNDGTPKSKLVHKRFKIGENNK